MMVLGSKTTPPNPPPTKTARARPQDNTTERGEAERKHKQEREVEVATLSSAYEKANQDGSAEECVRDAETTGDLGELPRRTTKTHPHKTRPSFKGKTKKDKEGKQRKTKRGNKERQRGETKKDKEGRRETYATYRTTTSETVRHTTSDRVHSLAANLGVLVCMSCDVVEVAERGRGWQGMKMLSNMPRLAGRCCVSQWPSLLVVSPVVVRAESRQDRQDSKTRKTPHPRQQDTQDSKTRVTPHPRHLTHASQDLAQTLHLPPPSPYPPVGHHCV